MGKNKGFRKRIRSLEGRIREHQAKLDAEVLKERPDEGHIAHWKLEIRGWKNQIAKLEKRLEK